MSSSCNSNYLRLFSYTKQLSSHVNCGRHEQAFSLFHHLQASLSLDPFVFPLLLKSCAATRCTHLGTSIHAHVAKSSLLHNPFVACALVDFYGKCVSLPSARKVFDEIPHRNVVVWNAMISLYSHSNNASAALELFETMDVVPNPSTFNSIIACLRGESDDMGAYRAIAFYRRMQGFGVRVNLITVLALLPAIGGLGALNLIKEIHGYTVRNGIDPHPQLRSCLIEAYGRCGHLDHADSVFCSMEERERDVVAWSSLISAYALHGDARKALQIFREMELANVKPDAIAFLAVLKACSHVGLADEAKEYFVIMQNRYNLEATSDHYSCLVDALGRAGRLHEAYGVIQSMPMKATAKTWGALLGACRNYGDVEFGEVAGRALFEIEPENAANYVLLARIYDIQGKHEEAKRVKREMQERKVKSAPGSSWVL